MTGKRILTLIGLVVGVLAVAAQFYLTISARLANGDSVTGALFFFFTFLTILSNLMLVLSYASELSAARWLGWWRQPATRAMMAGIIALVMIYYHVFLSSLRELTGLAAASDVALHYVAPTLYIVWWLVTQQHGLLRLGDIPRMLLPPIVYLAIVAVRGAFVGEYPYPAMDVVQLGYPQVGLNMLLVAIGLTALYLLVIGLDRLLGRGKTA